MAWKKIFIELTKICRGEDFDYSADVLELTRGRYCHGEMLNYLNTWTEICSNSKVFTLDIINREFLKNQYCSNKNIQNLPMWSEMCDNTLVLGGINHEILREEHCDKKEVKDSPVWKQICEETEETKELVLNAESRDAFKKEYCQVKTITKSKWQNAHVLSSHSSTETETEYPLLWDELCKEENLVFDNSTAPVFIEETLTLIISYLEEALSKMNHFGNFSIHTVNEENFMNYLNKNDENQVFTSDVKHVLNNFLFYNHSIQMPEFKNLLNLARLLLKESLNPESPHKYFKQKMQIAGLRTLETFFLSSLKIEALEQKKTCIHKKYC